MEQKIKEEVKQQIAEMVANGLPAGVGEIIIREGKAVELKEPVKVKIQGTIDAAARWLETRFDCIKEKTCHVIVNREQLTIALQCNENNHYGTLVVGSLTLSPEYKRFGINEGEYITNFEMAELIKMNRSFFDNKSVAMKLVTDNLPEAFTLILPIFKGTAKQTIAVEVYVNPSDFSCTLVSPEANDLVEEMRDREIDAVLERIKERCPDIVIIEQ